MRGPNLTVNVKSLRSIWQCDEHAIYTSQFLNHLLQGNNLNTIMTHNGVEVGSNPVFITLLGDYIAIGLINDGPLSKEYSRNK